MGTTVVAAQVEGPGRAGTIPLELGPLAPGSVRVALAGCGVCGSNLATWEGRAWFSYPLAPGAPGHEAWGTVVEVGAEVSAPSGLLPGVPVALLYEAAFAEMADIPASQVVPLPEALAGCDFPGEALGCGFNVARRADFRPGQKVAVVGIGFLGAVVTAVAARAGAEVLAISRRPTALGAAKLMGAAETLALDDPEEVVAEVGRLTGGDLCPVVVEAVGLQAPLDLAGRLTGFGGRLVVAGFHQDGLRQVDMQLWNWRGIDVVNAHERDPEVALDGIRRAAEAASDWLDATTLYTHRYPLSELGAAMEAMRTRPDGFLKALVVT